MLNNKIPKSAIFSYSISKRILPGIFIFISSIFSSCSYYIATKQNQIQTTPVDIGFNLGKDCPILETGNYNSTFCNSKINYEVISVDNKPVVWATKDKILSLPPGEHQIGIICKIDYWESILIEDRTTVTGDAWGHINTDRTSRSSPQKFSYQGVISYDFKKKSRYAFFNNRKYNEEFQVKITKYTFWGYWSKTKSGDIIVGTAGLLGIVTLLVLVFLQVF